MTKIKIKEVKNRSGAGMPAACIKDFREKSRGGQSEEKKR